MITQSIAKISGSASKIVFMGLAFTACVAFMTGRLESQDFMVLVSGAFTFYFAHKGSEAEPFAGK